MWSWPPFATVVSRQARRLQDHAGTSRAPPNWPVQSGPIDGWRFRLRDPLRPDRHFVFLTFRNPSRRNQWDISPILPPGVPVFCGATRNVGDAKIDGVEVEFDARPVPGLSIDGSFSWIGFRFVSGLENSSIVTVVTDPVFVPKWKYALGAQYEVDLDALGTLTPRLDWQWQSEIQSTLPNNLPGRTFGEVESRGLMNARLTYRTADEDWEVALAATNLFDKFYYANKYDQVVQSGNAFGLPGRPREVMVSLKRNF